jgi:ferrous iron transport protein A
MLQLTFKSQADPKVRQNGRATGSLADLRQWQHGILDRIDLPEDQALRLMELGFLPGARVVAGRGAPGGDPRVYRVDGSEFALRRETASRLKLRPAHRDLA